MAHSQEVSRPGNVQVLYVEHEGEEYEAEKKRYQTEVDGEIVEVEEYRLDEYDDEEIPDEVAAEVEEINAERE